STCVSFCFSSRRRHTRFSRDWSSDVCSSDLNDIVGHHRRGGIAERTGISIGPQRRGGQRIGRVDRVSSPDRVILVSLERLAAVGAGPLEPRVELRLVEHELHVSERRLRVLRVLEDDRRGGLVQLHLLADRAYGEVRGADVLGNIGQLRIVLGRVIKRDAVRRYRYLAREERAVVIDVEPALSARNEGLVELASIAERGDRLWAVDDDLAVLVHHLAAVAPQNPMAEVVAVAHAVAECEAHWVAVGLQSLAEFEEGVRILGESGEARLLDPALAIADSVADGRERQRDPAAVALGISFEAFIPAAVLLAEPLG